MVTSLLMKQFARGIVSSHKFPYWLWWHENSDWIDFLDEETRIRTLSACKHACHCSNAWKIVMMSAIESEQVAQINVNIITRHNLPKLTISQPCDSWCQSSIRYAIEVLIAAGPFSAVKQCLHSSHKKTISDSGLNQKDRLQLVIGLRVQYRYDSCRKFR